MAGEPHIQMEQTTDTTARFLEAYDSLSDAIFKHCYFRVYDREKAKDLTQECFLRAWECLAEGQDILNLKAFIFRIARNLVIDHSRKAKPVSLDDLLDVGFAVPSALGSESILREVDASLLMAHLHRMEEPYREALMLRYLEGLGPQEIAEVCGEKENAVSVRINRGLKKLRAAFDAAPSA